MTDRISRTCFCVAVVLAVTAAPAAARDGGESSAREASAATTVRASGDAITVDAAIDEALERNPEIRAVRARLEIAHAQLVKARALSRFNPEIGVAAGNRSFDDGGSEVQPSADVSIEIEVAGQRAKRIEAADHELARTRAEVADAERLLRAQVSEEFYRAIHAAERLAYAQDIAERSRRLADASEARYRAGDVAKTEPNLAAVRYARSRRDLLVATRDRDVALRELARLLGRAGHGSARIRGELRAATSALPDVDQLVESALRQRPDLMASSARLDRIEAEQALARRLAVPNVTVGAFFEEEAEADGARDQIIGAGIRVPLPIFDRQQSERASLTGEHTQAEHERQAKALAVETEVRDAHRALRAAAETVAVYESDALERIEESLRFVETAYGAGKVGLLELIVVQSELLDARAGYIDALWEYRQAQIALELSVGASPTPASTKGDFR